MPGIHIKNGRGSIVFFFFFFWRQSKVSMKIIIVRKLATRNLPVRTFIMGKLVCSRFGGAALPFAQTSDLPPRLPPQALRTCRPPRYHES